MSDVEGHGGGFVWFADPRQHDDGTWTSSVTFKIEGKTGESASRTHSVPGRFKTRDQAAAATHALANQLVANGGVGLWP